MGKKKESAEDVATGTIPWNDDYTLLWAHKTIKLNGPKGTFSTTDYGHGQALIVANDDLTIQTKALEMQNRIKDLNEGARDDAYQELLDSIQAVANKEFD